MSQHTSCHRNDISSVISGDVSSQGLEIVFRVGLAILQMNQTELIQLDMEGMLQVTHNSRQAAPSHQQNRRMHRSYLCPSTPDVC